VSTGYEALLSLALRERELLDESRFDEIEALGPEWEAVAADLPAPTQEDRVLLEEIELTVWSSVAALRLVLDETAQLHALIRTGRHFVGSYAGAGLDPMPNLHT
jgi:hypothetical protein